MLTVRMQHGPVTVAGLPEEIDHHNARQVGDQCGQLVGEGCRLLVLDASLTHYLDSSAITMLLILRRTVEEHAGILRIAALNTHYRSIFTRLGVDSLLSVFPTLTTALEQTQPAGMPSTAGCDGLDGAPVLV